MKQVLTEDRRDDARRQRFRILASQRRRLARWGEGRPGLTDARPPEQPVRGPGGKEYQHRQVRATVHGEGALAYWLFEPTEPTPATAPLIVFLHGWGGNNPASFGAWIDHVVKRGNLVLFPVYHDFTRRTSPSAMLANVVMTVKDATVALQREGRIRPDLQRVAYVGHSIGGVLAVQLAAVPRQEGLPVPKALMPVAPGIGAAERQSAAQLRQVPSTVLLLVVVGEDDQNVGDRVGRIIFLGTPQIPLSNKNLVVLRSDYHGTPPLVANHRAPGAANPAYWIPRDHAAGRRLTAGSPPADLPPADALDYYGYWKFLDGLTDAAFYGRHRVYALGDTPQQRFMGLWSDGTPVEEPWVITHPGMLW